MRYLYEGHMGNLYTHDKPLGYKDLHCEACGDSDWMLGAFTTIKDFWDIVKDNCDIDGCGGWALQYVYPFIVREFYLPDVVEYEDDCGLCSHSDQYILDRINRLIESEGIV